VIGRKTISKYYRSIKNIESQIEGSKPVVINFYAEWNTLCRLMRPLLQDIREKVGTRAAFLEMDMA